MLARPAPAPAKSRILAYSAPAPVGGLNAASAMAAMPPEDCLLLWNLIPSELGLRTRLGYYEFAVGATGSVRSLLPFNAANPTNNRLFAVTSAGIYNATAGGTLGAKVVTFAITSGLAGYGTHHPVVTAAGHFLAYCDEANGYYLYKESTGAWEKVKAAATIAWTVYTATLGDLRTNDTGKNYVCTQGGLTAGTGPTGTGTGIVDGAATWDFYLPLTAGTTGTTLNPADAVFCTVWKHRLWLVERNTAKGYFLDLDAVYGPATPISFAGKFKAGGGLRGLWSWTGDGGSGIDDRLVGISDGGDVAIYEGTDPSLPGAFELKGVWQVGGVPSGRRVCSDIGGDLLVLSYTGVLALSKLIIGNPIVDRTQYATVKVTNLFNYLVQSYGANAGWSVRLHPQDGTLLINVPGADGSVSEQLAMSVTTRAWGRYRYAALTFTSCEAYGGKLYYGTTDGRIVVNDGYVDNVKIATPSVFDTVDFFVLTSFQKLGSPRQKRVQIIRPTVTAQGVAPNYLVKAVYKYDLSEFTGGEAVTELAGAKFGVYTPPDTGASVFDTATFFATDYVSEQRITGGAGGIGTEVAVAMSGKSAARTVIIGWDVMFDQGGYL